ncbi:MAG TPA: hypothetical protein VGA22_11120 [Gemmatimonadales bacterium]|jgi:hypothetical protein
MAALRAEVSEYKRVTQTEKKQKADGVWAGNMLGVAASKAQGIRGVGTVAQYRHLLELGVPPNRRALRLADRVFYRTLSRDDDPALAFEFRKPARTNPRLAEWGRQLIRQGITAALARAGWIEDPRVRGAAHRTATDVSHFLRSESAQKPIVRKGSRNMLHPDANPPTLFLVATVAHMPNLQRERAGFVDRLTAYITQPAPRRTFSIMVGRKVVKPTVHLLGEPLAADSAGHPKDLPFALHWIELLVRLKMLERSTVAMRILSRLLKDCDERGVWAPKNLRTIPKSPSRLADFAFPLELDGKTLEQRQADVTFRLSLIARLAEWDLSYT